MAKPASEIPAMGCNPANVKQIDAGPWLGMRRTKVM
jgi:hypothetical protein